MAILTIFPSAGHHNADSGAYYNGRKESEEMKCFRDLVIRALTAKGYPSIPDHDNETASQHQARIKPGNGSVVIEFHLNAAANITATGTEAVVKENPTKNSVEMAAELVDVTAKILGIKSRGVLSEARTARRKIGIVNKAGTTALLEICFLSNPKDMAAYDANKTQLATAVADILIKYENLI